MKAQRACFSSRIEPFRSQYLELIPILAAGDSKWYVSFFLEQRNRRIFKANDKSANSENNIIEGAILRIYDGYTLYEHALANIAPEYLKEEAKKFSEKIKQKKYPTSIKSVYYTAPSWKIRLSEELDQEIVEQIPSGVKKDTPVHFGTPSMRELWKEDSSCMEYLKNSLVTLKECAAKNTSNDPAANPDFSQVTMALMEEHSLFIDSEVNISQTILRNRLSFHMMKGNEHAYESIGGVGGRETIEYDTAFLNSLYEQLRKKIKAERLSPGRYQVLMSPDVTGVFAHEAFGHSQEGDTCARGRSKAWDLFHSKESVGNQHATILNNPAIYQNGSVPYGAWGSYYFDEEGWFAKEQVLVKEGILQTPMTNLTSSIRLNVPRSANGKREDWSHAVYTRQTNTYFSQGDCTLEELLKKVDYGFLASNSAGGMEDPKGMGIQVGIAFLEEIKNGKLTGKTFIGPSGGPVQMTGYTPDYLNSIIAKSKIEFNSKSKDSAKHPFNTVGGCGKYHKEIVVAGSGGPYMLVDNVLLG